MFNHKCRISTLLAVAFALGSNLAGNCREQWAMTHPPGTPPTAPVSMGSNYMGNVNPKAMSITGPESFTPEFWQGQHVLDRVPVGTVLTGVIDDTISSASSKVGDIFSITLSDGFVASNNKVILPKGCRIVGKVLNVTPSVTQNHGNPGSIQISLQSLVLPDGTNIPFFGFIARNHNMEQNEPPPVKQAGYGFSDVPGSFMGWMGSLPMGMGGYSLGKGAYMRSMNQGNEYVLEKGEIVPVRLNRTLVVPEMNVNPQTTADGHIPYGQPVLVPYGQAEPIPQGQQPVHQMHGPGQMQMPYGNQPVNRKPNYTSSGVPGLMTTTPNHPISVKPQMMSEVNDPF